MRDQGVRLEERMRDEGRKRQCKKREERSSDERQSGNARRKEDAERENEVRGVSPQGNKRKYLVMDEKDDLEDKMNWRSSLDLARFVQEKRRM
jgi:hypothetical protein